jgi:hypothetical protein
MEGHFTYSRFHNVILLAIFAAVLSGCLSDEESADTAEFESDNEISGSVGDGPVIGASMRIFRNDGTELASFESDANAGYNIVVRTKGKYYPLSINASNGTDIVTNSAPDFELLGAVFEPGKKSVANVNPFSTLAVELARDLTGGENKSNLAAAQNTVVTQLNHGLASLAASGPMTTKINGSNIAEILRASEALGETIRRTRNAVSASGFSASGNSVVRALGSDLTDGVVDGLGGSRTDARSAAVSTVVAAQVLLETMANELHVNGIDGTQAMSDAINQVSLQIADPSLGDLTTTLDMLSRARIGLDAAFAVTSDPLIEELLVLVRDLQPNTSSETIRSLVLPNDYRRRLDNAILLVAGGSSGVHETVNAISRSGGSSASGGSGNVNTAPTISGAPAATVSAGSNYSFTPDVSDAENDSLTFEITNQPSWASFNSMSGQLSGVPADIDAGLYSNIIFSVTDGEFSSNLPMFSITVSAPPTANSPPQIVGTPAPSVLVGNAYSFVPDATDADNDTLSFSVAGLPAWASFNTANGAITGTPESGDVGTYSNIAISVSDGQANATTAPFSITVNVIATASVTLSWTPPTENTDGSALIDLAGYNIYWGVSPGSYSNSVRIDNGSVSTYVVENLVPGTYEFVATSINSAGVESSFSSPTIKVAQ